MDGTHCPIEAPMPFSTKWSSNKLGGSAGVDYELGIAIHDNQLAWINGPFRAGENKITIYRKANGLKYHLPMGKCVIGDRGYSSKPNTISTQNDLRVLARHKTFHGCLKRFKCLCTKFCHGVAHHKIVFESLCDYAV